MHTLQATNDFNPKRRGYGDGALIFGLLNSNLWLMVFGRFKQAIVRAFLLWFQFNAHILAFCMNPFRICYGIQNCGFLLALCSVGTMIVFNSIHIWKGFTALMIYALPALPFFYDWSTISKWVFEDYESVAMFYYTLIATAFMILNIILVYAGFGNRSDLTKRGESSIYLLTKKAAPRLPLNEFFVICFIECGILVGTGYYFWVFQQDQVFGLFCFLMAGSELGLQIKAKTTELHRKSHLSA